MSSFGGRNRRNEEEEIHMVTNSLYDRPWRNTPTHRNGRPMDMTGMSENEKFLPVKLDPGWDGLDRHPDELNFRALERVEELENNPPPDRFRIVYLVMMIHGIGILMPWNMFITAQAYFENYKLNATEGTVLAEYRKNFMSYLGIASQFPNVAMNAFNLFVQCGGSASSIRIVWSILIMVVVFIATVALAMIDTSAWAETFFWITMASVVVLNMACGVYQNSAYGLAGILPMKYTNAIVFGNNLSGTLVAVINILSVAGTPNIRTSAIYYFVTAIVVLLIAFDAYFVLPLTKFYRHYKTIVKLKLQASNPDGTSQTCCERMRGYWHVFKKIWVLCWCVWFVFFVTLSLFPAVQSNIEKLDFPIEDKYWKPIFCFLSFNFFAMIGNLVTEWVRVPGPRWLWIPVLLRGLIFIPLFLMCNFRPDTRSVPVLISNDYVYIILGVLMAFTSGYFSSLCMMYGPKQVSPEVAGTAGMMMAFFLVLGIVCGVWFSLALSNIIEKI